MQPSIGRSLIVLMLLSSAPVVQSSWSTAAAGAPQEIRSVLLPVLTTLDVTVGQQQLVFGLVRDSRTFVTQATVIVRLYPREDPQADRRPEVRAFYHPYTLEEQLARAPFAGEMATDEMPGVYVAQVTFDRPGPWVIEIALVQEAEPPEVSRSTIVVHAAAPTSALGAAAQH